MMYIINYVLYVGKFLKKKIMWRLKNHPRGVHFNGCHEELEHRWVSRHHRVVFKSVFKCP